MLLKFNFITNGIIYKISNDIYVSQFVLINNLNTTSI